MDTKPAVITQRRRKSRIVLRFGCRNCRLRRVKCDEAKPRCRRCEDYGVVCNFVAGASDLQPKVSEHQWKISTESPTIFRPPVKQIIICSDGTSRIEMDTRSISWLERFRLDCIHSFTPNMSRLWRDTIPGLAFTYPPLMHAILAVSASRGRYRRVSRDGNCTEFEAFHVSQSIITFNRKLSQPVQPPDRDAMWATSAIIGLLSIVSFDTVDPEEAWPLQRSSPSDLDWFHLTEDKKVVWRLTDPSRPDSIFHVMADEYATECAAYIPEAGTEGIPLDLAQVCGLTATSNKVNSPYFVAAHLLAELMREVPTYSVRMTVFVSLSERQYRSLLAKKDPVALLLLALWYATAGKQCWWIEQRAVVEGQAIRMYLERYHPHKHNVLKMLPQPSSLST